MFRTAVINGSSGQVRNAVSQRVLWCKSIPAGQFTRRYTSGSANKSQQKPVTIEEPGEGGGRPLYYHLLPVLSTSSTQAAKYKWGISFNPNPPVSLEHQSILGTLPARQASEVTANLQQDNFAIQDFEENPVFVSTLHKAIRSVLNNGEDDILQAEAQARGEGWMHICDNRVAPALNRIPDPDDILGSVMVEKGEIFPDSYQQMPSYRVISRENGPPVLTKTIHAALLRLTEA